MVKFAVFFGILTQGLIEAMHPCHCLHAHNPGTRAQKLVCVVKSELLQDGAGWADSEMAQKFKEDLQRLSGRLQ